MFYKVFPFLLTVVGANPIYVGTPLTLERAFPGVSLHHLSQLSPLISQPLTMLYQYGNIDPIGSLSKGLLTSHLGGQKFKDMPVPIVHPTTLALASPLIHHATPIPVPIKKGMEFPEKTIAGALIKQVPKVSKLPISVSFSPKSLELSSIAQSGILEGGFSGASVLPGTSFANGLGISY